ncbi:MAG: hypothetical protein OEW79_04185 [Betaproteobacteria bacterium]|jgi:hypothetical protein|nr:hypothetical protein [Betaproteobacteria bacterium]MDH4292747.1 hypothetical protein [Betaproteobacteria bacterium]MDH5342012.1 hypothetical protein [Betaproteobacteria bacterium]
MTEKLDLLKIAQEEQDGDLFKLLDGIYKRSKVQPRGIKDAIIWEGGNSHGDVKPVAHAFTDMFALNGTLMALDVLGLPFLGVPMMAQFRHDTKLASLEWFGKLDYTALKWSTAGDFMVNDNGKKVVVAGKSANAPLRTAAGVYCNVRPYGTITSVRFMPGLPYSQDKKKFSVDRATGNIHSEMNTPGIRMAFAARLFLKMVHETGQIGRVATKPTQAQEDAINAGIMRWLLQGTKFQLKRQYTVDAYEEHKANVDAIVAVLPKDFKAGMESWGGEIYEHISDTNFGLLLHDMIEQRGAIVYATDLDGDRLTDLMADAPDVLRKWGQMVLDHAKTGKKMQDVWKEMGFTMTNGKDMTSVMYRMEGAPIFEQTLGSADAMLLRLLAGDETVGGEKQPYDPRIHFVLINEAYKAANPGNTELAKWLDAQLATFDKIYGGKRPRYIDGYNQLKAAIKPWGSK